MKPPFLFERTRAILAVVVRRKRPLRCRKCGYEIRSYRVVPPCPMCRAKAWEPAPWRPFTRVAEL